MLPTDLFFTLLLFFLYIVLYRLHTLLPARMKRKKLYFVKNEQKRGGGTQNTDMD